VTFETQVKLAIYRAFAENVRAPAAESLAAGLGASLEDTPHHRLITPVQARNLRPRDATELRADDLVQYESADRRRARRY